MEKFSGHVFVGENRSSKAVQNGWSWNECLITDRPRLCAIQLFDALKQVGLNPNNQIYLNLWHDDMQINQPMVEMVKEISENYSVVGMGRKVQAKLDEEGISHKKLVHPAARGKWRRQKVYRDHAREVLEG